MSEEIKLPNNIKIGYSILAEIKKLRQDLHWLLQTQAGSPGRIFDENGCSCAHFRDVVRSEQWECPLHGKVKRVGAWKEPE